MTHDTILAAWALIALMFVACEALSLLTRGRFAGISGLMDRLAGSSNVRFLALFVGWMWVGWHFFVR